MKTKKLLSLLLSIVLIFSTLPLPVLADTLKPVLPRISAETFNKTSVKDVTLSSMFHFDKDLPRYNWGPSAPAPAKLEGVTYKLADNVVKVNSDVTKNIRSIQQVKDSNTAVSGNISRIIGQGGLMKADQLQAATGLSTIKPGSVFVDLDNDLAFKVPTLPAETGDQFQGYVPVIKPDLQEVVKEFKIPQQTVQLNKTNVTHFTSDVNGNSLDKYMKKPGQTYVMTQNTTTDPTEATYVGSQNTTMEPIGPTHLQNIIAEFYFPSEGVTLTGTTPSGGEVAINIKGYLGIGDMTLDGYYDKWDYAFYFSVAEELQLQASLAAELKEEVRIPILGVDVGSNSDIGSIAGGLFIIVGIDGKFTLQVEARQWMKLNKVGLKGDNFFYIPCTIRPLLEPGESGFKLDSQFNGAIDGYIKGGALLELNLLGLDIVGAGVFAGMGAKTVISGEYLEADLYGIIQAYIKFFGKHKNIINWTPTILHKRQTNTAGYIITFKEACAYRDEVWGTVTFDAGVKGNLSEPGKDIVLWVRNSLGVEEDYPSVTDENGNFHLTGVDLRKNDQVYVRLQEREGTAIVRSEAVHPTFPFDKVITEEADFFNDYVRGYVPSAIVKNWNTGGQEEIVFDVNKSPYSSINVKLPQKEVPVTLDSNGFFNLTGTNILPSDEAYCEIKFDGWVVDSAPVVPTVDFQAQSIRTRTYNGKTVEKGKPVDVTDLIETIIITNMRGMKQYNGAASFTVSAYTQSSMGCYIINPDTGLPLLQVSGLPGQTQPVTLSSVQDATEDALGASYFTNKIIKKWFWEPKPSTNPLTRSVAPIKVPSPVLPEPTPGVINPNNITLQPKEISIPKMLQNLPQHTFTLSYDDPIDRYYQYKFDIYSNLIDGSYTIRWDDKIVIKYEGAEILLEIKDYRRDTGGDSKFENLSGDWTQRNIKGMLNRYMEKMGGSLIFPMPDQMYKEQGQSNMEVMH